MMVQSLKTRLKTKKDRKKLLLHRNNTVLEGWRVDSGSKGTFLCKPEGLSAFPGKGKRKGDNTTAPHYTLTSLCCGFLTSPHHMKACVYVHT